MKFFVLMVIIPMFIACSSANKQPDKSQSQPNPPAPVVQESTQATPKPDFEVVKKETCELDSDKRLLEVRKKTKGCDLAYTKFSKEKIVASGRYGIKHCIDTMDKIAKKLEGDKLPAKTINLSDYGIYYHRLLVDSLLKSLRDWIRNIRITGSVGQMS